MQYVRSISGSVSKTWNSINPATLSGAIDVIVIEQEDGSLTCAPFDPSRTMTPLSGSPGDTSTSRSRQGSFGDEPEPGKLDRAASDDVLLTQTHSVADHAYGSHAAGPAGDSDLTRSRSPPPLSLEEAVTRATALSKKLSGSNIRSHVTETGDLMLDMTGYKSNEEDALRAEVVARKILSEELEGCYDIGALIGADEHGNLWIYSSEEAKEAANRRAAFSSMRPGSAMSDNAISDPGYHSDGDKSVRDSPIQARHHRTQSDVQPGIPTPPQSPTPGETTRNYAKTLRLTSDQLKALNLKPGANDMSFSVNRATCTATMLTISGPSLANNTGRSDALGHVLNMIGRDWTHAGVAKLYTDIVNNGYNIMYLTSRSVGQADTTRAYIYGVNQDGYRLPKGPVITSPDRMIAALRREIYLRKPEVFKMACLRDILNLFNGKENPFYAGFGNRLTDALSYRSVNIPSTRIFTINSNAEVSLDLLSLNKYKSSYVTMQELLDHFFPPVSLLVQAGGEEYTDFTYWREPPPELADFSSSDSEDDEDEEDEDEEDEEEDDYDAELSDEEGSEVDEDAEEDLGNSYISQASLELADSQSHLDDDEADDEGADEVPNVSPKPSRFATAGASPSPKR
ncbi:unnamed protein product [Aspergillus oryzae]|uniref:Unnamed protein product n=1 Tax=Aspergillus oryzae var. brunneus TaxID=332754 RepID=A0ABQ6L6P9_ASPOZ|nr:unnamed protein product [Aspergillus oryzae]GMF85830.1 unnamed protein product [Aspergillus oryzae]GMG01238.1 unnamed protein product [Aspergillus oryzae]GMG51738.1 unnamed protein product [Aspergillus oryzae var. brunneus]